MDEYEAHIRKRFPRVILVEARTPLPDDAGEGFDAFLVPPDRVEEFRSFVSDDLAAFAERIGRRKPVVVVHCASEDRPIDPPVEFR